MATRILFSFAIVVAICSIRLANLEGASPLRSLALADTLSVDNTSSVSVGATTIARISASSSVRLILQGRGILSQLTKACRPGSPLPIAALMACRKMLQSPLVVRSGVGKRAANQTMAASLVALRLWWRSRCSLV